MNRVVKNGLVRVAAFIVDVFIVILCYFLSARFASLIHGSFTVDYKFPAAYLICVLFFFFMFDLYAAKENSREDTFVSVVLSAVGSTVCVYLINFIFKWNCQDIMFWFAMFMLSTFLLLVWRLVLSFGMTRFREKKKILIVESVNVTSRLARKIKYSCTDLNTAWYHLVDENNQAEVDRLLNSLIPDFDSVFISPSLPDELSDRIFHRAMMLKKNVSILATLSNVATMRGLIHQFGDTPVIEERGIWMTKFQRFFKRIFDLAFALVGLTVTSPIFILCALAIKLGSPGPVIYRQERYTIYKKRFMLYKFRTMGVDAEKDGAQLSTKDDPRVTGVGKIIRMLRLDELPQLFNIFCGNMSVVGPRPERPVFADEYCEKVKNYQMRYYFKAGLTGYAQVYGKYNTRASDKILLDMIYAVEYSFWLDIKLVMLTVKTMFIRSSTEGIEWDTDRLLNSSERELERRRCCTEYVSDEKKTEQYI